MKTSKNDLKIFSDGKNENRSIIFIHGFPFDYHMWEQQLKVFCSNFFCVAYDIRGLGESPAHDGQFTMETFVDDLASLIDEMKLNKPVLCALSMGGYIALRAVERMEEKFAGLILCDTKSEADNNETKLKRAAAIKQIDSEGLETFINQFLPNTFKEESINKKDGKYREILERAKNSDPIGIKGCLLAMAGRTDTTDYLSKIKLPVLILCGEDDKITPPDVMRKMSEKIKDSEFHIVPYSAHMSPVENPEFVNEKIENFLNKKIR